MNVNPVNTRPLKIAAAILTIIIIASAINVYNTRQARRQRSHRIIIRSHKRGACEIAGYQLLEYLKDNPETETENENWLEGYTDYVVNLGSVFFHEKPEGYTDRSFDMQIYIIAKPKPNEDTPILVGYSDITGSKNNEPHCNAIFTRAHRVIVVQQFKEKELIRIVGYKNYASRKTTLYFAPFRK